MFDSAVVEVIIALVFLLALLSVAVSALTEAMSRFVGLRGAQLLRGIKSLVDGSTGDTQFTTTYRLLGSVFIGTAGQQGRTRDSSVAGEGLPSEVAELLDEGAPPAAAGAAGAPPGEIAEQQKANLAELAGDTPTGGGGPSLWKRRRQLPSYIASRQFASAVFDQILPENEGEPPAVDALRARIDDTLGDSPLRDALVGIVNEVGSDVVAIRQRVETLYDDHMDRVSGWYKRHAARIQIAVAAVVVLLFNANLLRVADFLYTDDAERAAVVQVAGGFSCPAGDDGSGAPAADCVDEARRAVEELGGRPLPLFWNANASCEEAPGEPEGLECFLHARGIWEVDESPWRNLFFVVVGYVVTVLGLLPGSRFWFDALGRLNSLRSTGSKPAESG